jgi:hypothetical protein
VINATTVAKSEKWENPWGNAGKSMGIS